MQKQKGEREMFGFLKKRVYRAPFFTYTAALLLCCVLLCSLLVENLLQGQSHDAAFTAVQAAFDLVRGRASADVQKVDDFFLRLYSMENNALRRDFYAYLQGSESGYLRYRAENPPARSSDDIITCIQELAESTQYGLCRITFVDSARPQQANVIQYGPSGGSDILFGTENVEADAAQCRDFLVVRRVMDIRDSQREAGRVYFRFRWSSVFGALDELSAGTAAVGLQGQVYCAGEQDCGDRKDELRTALQQQGQGTMRTGLRRMHRLTVPLQSTAYRITYLISDEELIRRDAHQYRLLVLGILLLFVLVSGLIAMRMHYDARALDCITSAIEKAKGGRLTTIRLEKRKDEYGIIAAEFNDMTRQLQAFIRREYSLKLKQREAQMKAMQQQVNPHFLYNTLEIIRARALMSGNSAVAEAVSNLGNMFRAVSKADNVIPVEEELQILGYYLKIMEFKRQDRFFYRIDVEPALRRMRTVKFWMQPVVENFFVHGAGQGGGYDMLELTGCLQADGSALFTFMDNGVHIAADKLSALNHKLTQPERESREGAGIGLQNVYTRLCFFYGGGVRMWLTNNKEAGVTVHVCVEQPFTQRKGEEDSHV